jgi:intracellular septation protein
MYRRSVPAGRWRFALRLDKQTQNTDTTALLFSRPFMKFLFDFFPVVLFFIAFKLQGIYVATAVAIVATLLQIGWVWFRRRKVDTMLWVSLAVIVVFGGATLALHDETFIKWKPSVLYWLFGAVLLGAQVLFGRNLIRALMGKEISLPDAVWNRLNLSWVGFFLAMGVLNLAIAFNFETDTWVNFKVFGGLGLTLVFVVLQAVALARFVQPKEKN